MAKWVVIPLVVVSAEAFFGLSTKCRSSWHQSKMYPVETSSLSQLTLHHRTGRAKMRYLLSVADENINSDPTIEDNTPVAEGNSSSSNKNTEGRTKESSLATGVFGITKAMLGTGVLALPGGLAAMSDFPGMLWPANILMAAMAALSGYTFSLYGRLHFSTNTNTLDGLWRKVFPKNAESGRDTEESKTPISFANFFYCYGCCLIFLLVIGDSLTSLAQLICGGTTPRWISRQSIILTVATTCLWPLCNLKSLQALAPVSLLGVIGCLVTTAFVVWRCPVVNPSSPYAAQAGAAAVAQFSTYNRIKGPAPLVLFSMGCIALMAHFSAPDFLDSFRPVVADNTQISEEGSLNRRPIHRYNQMTIMGYALVTIINAITLSCGFLTFGGKSSSIILNSYAATDRGAALSRFLTAISVGGSFPILFSACRSSAYNLFGLARDSRKKLTAMMLASLTAIALVVKDAGFVVSFTGALMGTAILYIFPSLMFLRWTKDEITLNRKVERAFCRFLTGFGVIATIVGAVTCVLNSYFPHLLA